MSRANEIGDAIARVHGEIAEAERRAGRTPGSARLIAVSKKMAVEDIVAAASAGQLDFGENYAQELRDKRATLAAIAAAATTPAVATMSNVRWHLIGPLQANKVKYVAGQVAFIHTVDRVDLVREIDRRAVALGVDQPCLVQVNVAGESQKAGVPPGALPAVLDAFAVAERASCVGLMLIPPLATDAQETRRHFAALRELAESEKQVVRPRVDLTELSMGMSADYQDAIAEGATLVRVGTAIFGARATVNRADRADR